MLFVTQKKLLSVHQIIRKQRAFNFGQKKTTNVETTYTTTFREAMISQIFKLNLTLDVLVEYTEFFLLFKNGVIQ